MRSEIYVAQSDVHQHWKSTGAGQAGHNPHQNHVHLLSVQLTHKIGSDEGQNTTCDQCQQKEEEHLFQRNSSSSHGLAERSCCCEDNLKADGGAGDNGFYFQIKKSEDNGGAVADREDSSIESSEEGPCANKPEVF